MRRITIPLAITMVVVTFAAACKGGTPTSPNDTPLPANGETFEVSGVVTDDHDQPIGAVVVTMAYWLNGLLRRSSAGTDASGRYTIGFTSSPWTSPSGRWAARAEIMADGYDWYWRTVTATGKPLIENFRLLPIKRITPGESIAVSVVPDNGDCLGWLYGPCGRVTVEPLTDGQVTIAADPIDQQASLPELEVCCVSGSEKYGNPVTIPVTAGTAVSVEVGQTGPSVVPSRTVIVKTSLPPTQR
jgi:hypothetical protein